MTHHLTSIDSDEAIKIAMQSAIDMATYYDKTISLIQNPEANAILAGLAEKHQNHRQTLLKAYSKLSGKKILYLRLNKRHKLSNLIPCGDEPNDAVRNAKKNEDIVKVFYATVSRRVYEPEIRLIFRRLADDEEQNLALLESSFEEPLTLDQEPIPEDVDYAEEMTSTHGERT